MTLSNFLHATKARAGLGQPASIRERGAVLVLVAATLVIVLISGAMAVDLSAVSTRGQSLQNAADAAALAGVEVWVDTGSQAGAAAVVTDMLTQNGVGDGDNTTFTVEFPSATEMRVLLSDTDPDVMLSGVVGLGDSVEREATARFLQCDADCSYEVLIPAPFKSVNASGTGDGYKPIPVGDRLYAINHNSSSGKIVCVDRVTEEQCWGSISTDAYADYDRINPEMPLTAVYGTRIFWSVSDTTGHRLFCFETATASPCATSWLLSSGPRATDSQISNRKDQNRGGGTVLVANKVYVFTDDHEVHCFNPQTNAICAGYSGGGKNNGLSEFPDNEPSDGNHGSSIDRVVDESTGKIYATIHINNAVSTGGIDCSTTLDSPEGRTVVIKNVQTGMFIDAVSGSDVAPSVVGTVNTAHWYVGNEDGSNISFESIAYGGQRMRSQDKNGDVSLNSSTNSRSEWRVDTSGGATTLRNDSRKGYMYDAVSDIVTDGDGDEFGDVALWKILPWQCGDPFYVPPPPPTLPYDEGTWLHCWSTLLSQPCAGFTPSRIHSNAARYSGRLFFYYAPTAFDGSHQIQGVCSTGYNGSTQPSNLEISCVDHVTGAEESGQESSLATLRSNIASNSDSSPNAWGDPHWNEEENRLFYPTDHTASFSKVLCWDFDSGWCGSRQGYAPNLGQAEDYGFFSEGNCVYGLGHTARFWAFHAEDINRPCTGSSTSTTIEPCDCSGTLAWGTLEFDVDVELFDEFDVVLVDADENQVYPVDGTSVHSIITDGTTIYLGDIPTTYPSLTVLVTVEAEDDPWAQGEQTFVIQFQRAPHLID